MASRSLRRTLFGNPVARTLLSVWAWLVLVVLLVVFLPLVAIVRLVTQPFDRGHYWAGWLFRRIGPVHQFLNPLWHFRTTGRHISDPRHPYVVVANHESFVDILLISHLPWEMKWLAKEDFFRYPLIGWLMRLVGDIRLKRGDAQSIVSAIKGCNDRLSKGVSVMLFPEGTRSRDGNLGEFMDGAFRIAVQNQVPVLPLVVNGSREALQAGSWRMNVTEAEVRVLDPIPTEGLTKRDVPALRDKVRQLIADELAAMRA